MSIPPPLTNWIQLHILILFINTKPRCQEPAYFPTVVFELVIPLHAGEQQAIIEMSYLPQPTQLPAFNSHFF